MTTDYRALCEELLEALTGWHQAVFETGTGWARPDETYLLDRARAALAEPVTKGVTDEAATEGAAELIYSQAMEWAARQPIPSGHINIPAWQQGGNSDAQEVARRTARAVLARYGHQPAPPVEGEVGELVRWLRGANWDGKRQSLATRAADLLERQAAPVLEPALARINDILNDSGRVLLADEREALELARQALEQRHPTPVPVSERLPGPEDCAPWPGEPNAGRWCWMASCVDNGWAWEQRTLGFLASFPQDFTHWLPATALPLPQGDVGA